MDGTRKELGRQCETEHRKDKKNNKNNKHNKNDGAGSRYMERLRSELFRKVQKYQKGSRKDREGQGKAGKEILAWKYISKDS